MRLLKISEVARHFSVQPSAIRYYERIGVLLPAPRISGQRHYDTAVLYRLAVIDRAREIGFTLKEIRVLFAGFGKATRASERWKRLCRRKLVELEALMTDIRTMRRLLKEMMAKCHCDTLDQCGKRIFRSAHREMMPRRKPRLRTFPSFGRKTTKSHKTRKRVVP